MKGEQLLLDFYLLHKCSYVTLSVLQLSLLEDHRKIIKLNSEMEEKMLNMVII